MEIVSYSKSDGPHQYVDQVSTWNKNQLSEYERWCTEQYKVHKQKREQRLLKIEKKNPIAYQEKIDPFKQHKLIESEYGFRIAKEVPEEIIHLLKRKPITWNQFQRNNQKENKPLLAQLHSVEETQFTDSEGLTNSGIGLYAKINTETVMYLHQPNFYLYGYIEIPMSWGEDEADQFINSVMLSDKKWLTFMDEFESDNVDVQMQIQTEVEKKTIEQEESEYIFKQRKYGCLRNKRDIMYYEIVDFSNVAKHRHVGKGIRFYLRNSFQMNAINTFFCRSSIKQAIRKYYEDVLEESEINNKLLFTLYETNVKIVERYMVDKAMAVDMWFEVPMTELSCVSKEKKQTWTLGGYELECDHNAVKPLPTHVQPNIPNRGKSHDKEVTSHKHEFPDAQYEQDLMYLISAIFFIEGELKPWTISVMVSSVIEYTIDYENKIIRIPVPDFPTLTNVTQSLNYIFDPDFRIAYNNCNFDDPYEAHYAHTLGMTKLVKTSKNGEETYAPSDQELIESDSFSRYGYFSRRKFYFCQCFEVKTHSKQTGSQKTHRMKIPGCYNIDIYLDVKMSWKLNSYKLDDVGNLFVNMTKVPLSAKEQFEYFEMGNKPDATPEEKSKHTDICDYCEQDCLIPKALYEYFNLRSKYSGGSRANYLNVEDMLWRGQQIRVYLNMLVKMRSKKCYRRLFLAPYRPNAREDKVKFADDPEESEYWWDTRYDALIGMHPGHECEEDEDLTPFQQLTEEAKIRKVKKELYESRTEQALQWDYELKVNDILDVDKNKKRKLNVFETKQDKIKKQKLDANTSTVYANVNPDNMFEEMKEAGKLNSLLVKARLATEGVTINNAYDQYKSLGLLKKEKKCKIKKKKKKEEDKYEGATVLEPKKGFHGDPVSTEDFASLYPNLARSRNMSHDTEVSDEEIEFFNYEKDVDYETTVMSRKQEFYQIKGLCKPCLEKIAQHKKDGKPNPKVVCRKCKETNTVDKIKIKQYDWRENIHYVAILTAIEQAHFIKKMCSECFDCKDCEKEREEDRADFCCKHETCPKEKLDQEHKKAYWKRHAQCYPHKHSMVDENETHVDLGAPIDPTTMDEKTVDEELVQMYKKYMETHYSKCPKYRIKAVLHEVITDLLLARKVAKNLMTHYEDEKNKHFDTYLKACGLPLNTKENAMPKPSTPEQHDIYLLYEIAKGLYGVYKQRQEAFKVTCNSVYGFTGAKFGILPRISIASGEGRSVIFRVKESLQYTANPELNKFKTARGNKPFDFWKTCHPSGLVPDDDKKANPSHYLLRDGDSNEVSVIVRFKDIQFKRVIPLTVADVERSYRDIKILYGDTDSVMNMYWLPEAIKNYTEPEEKIELDQTWMKQNIIQLKAKHSTVSFANALETIKANVMSNEWMEKEVQGLQTKYANLEYTNSCIQSELKKAKKENVDITDQMRQEWIQKQIDDFRKEITSYQKSEQWFQHMLVTLYKEMEAHLKKDEVLTPEKVQQTLQAKLENKAWIKRQTKKAKGDIEKYEKYQKWCEQQAILLQSTQTTLTEDQAYEESKTEFIKLKIKEIRVNVILGYVSCLSLRAAAYCTSLCLAPNSLEFEKIMWPFLLFSCKRYIYEKFELGNHSARGQSVYQGVSAKRRDFCLLLQQMYKKIEEMVMKTNDSEAGKKKAIAYVKKNVQDLNDGKFQSKLYMLELSKLYKDPADYKNPNQPHVHVASTRVARNPADKAHVGDRVAFFMTNPVVQPILGKSDKSITAKGEIKTWQRAEDPVYGEEHNIPYDPQYYIEQQLQNPITEMMTWFLYSDQIIKAEDDDFEDSLNKPQKSKKEIVQEMFETSPNTTSSNKTVRYTYEEAFEMTRRLLFGNIRKRKQHRPLLDEQAEVKDTEKRQKLAVINKSINSNILLYANVLENTSNSNSNFSSSSSSTEPKINIPIIQETPAEERKRDLAALEVIKKRKKEEQMEARSRKRKHKKQKNNK